MKTRDFMRELDKNLKDLPYDEKIELFRYYEEYFDDLGIGRDDEVPNSIDPKKIANELLLEYNIKNHKDNVKSKNPLVFTFLLIATIMGAPLSIPLFITFAAVFFSIILVLLVIFMIIVIVIFVVPITILYEIVRHGLVLNPLIGLGTSMIFIGSAICVYGILKAFCRFIANIYNKILVWIYMRNKRG